MSKDFGYKQSSEDEKRVVFTDNHHRHAKFTMKLKYLQITQSKFFRHIITGVLEDDPRIMNYVEEIAKRSKARKKKAQKLEEKGIEKYNELGFSDDEVENIFDMIESEFPDL
jgi:DNA-binding transcriptional regulator YhcF (GntR family)